VIACDGETIIEAAKRHGVEIPHLCYKEGMRPDGNCRACMVEVKGERVLAPSCCRKPAPGMEVVTDSARARASRRRWCWSCCSPTCPNERHTLASSSITGLRNSGRPTAALRAARAAPAADESHHGIAVHLDACIQCTRCVRACREEQVNDVIGYAFRGEHSKIVFDFDDPMGESTCVACGECVQACPTGR
jgi:formate dehydrogenase major subunit